MAIFLFSIICACSVPGCSAFVQALDLLGTALHLHVARINRLVICLRCLFLLLCLWIYLSQTIFFLCLWPTWHLYLNCLPRKSIALPLSSLLGEPVQGFFFRWKITHFCKIWFKGSLTNAPIRESSLPQVSYLDRQFRWKSLCQRGIHWKCRFNIT